MIGTDLFKISRIKLHSAFINFILQKDELVEFNSLSSLYLKKRFLASHIAAKEAIFKATQDPQYLSYQMLHSKNGQPYIKDHPEIEISISHDGDYVLSFVIIHPLSG